MRESITYQMILEEGREEGELRGEIRQARRDILGLGTRRFGAPATAAASRIQQLDDLNALDRLLDGVLRVSSWQELLALAPKH